MVLVAAAPAATPAQTPIETARGLLKQYQEDPTRIDRARDLLEAAVAKGGANDLPTLLTLTRAWFLYGEETRKHHADVIEEDIAQRTRIPKATITRLTQTLTAEGFLTRSCQLRKYRLAPAVLADDRTDLWSLVRP